MELEGLRGVAAVIVACYHFSLAFYLLAYFGKDSAPAQHLGLESFLYANPLGGLISGTFAVAIFFVLSGFVLSIGFFQTGKSSIIKKLAVKRYLRLMLPALASVLLCYFLMKVGLSHTQSAANVTHSIWLSQSWWFAPHLRDAFSQAVGGIFMSGTERPYNNVLWTMYYEFTGSFIIFASLLMFGRAKHRWLLYAALSYTTFNTWIFGFVLGMVLADLYSMGLIREKVRKWFVTVPLLLVAIYLGGYPFGEHLQNTAYGWIEKIPYQGLNFQMMSTVVGASILITVVLTTVQVARGLRHKYISRLGKYSFSLYLVHL